MDLTYQVSSEPMYDVFRFYVDGAIQVESAGTVAAMPTSYPIAAGTHVLTWVYDKDTNTSTGLDTAWIDDVVLSTSAP